MKVFVMNEVGGSATGDIFTLDVNEELELGQFKALCAIESKIANIVLIFEGKVLEGNSQSIKDLGIKDGDMILLRKEPQALSAQTSARIPGTAAVNNNNALANLDFSSITVPVSNLVEVIIILIY